MRVLLDARMGRKPSGIGQYILNLCDAFAAAEPETLRPVTRLRHYLRLRRLGLRPVLQERDLDVSALPAADVFHGPNFHAPRDAARTAVATIHDLAFLTLPECHPPGMPERLDGLIRASIPWTERFICDSEDTRAAFLDTYGFPEERCDAVPLGVDAQAYRPARDPAEVEAFRRRFSDGRPYLLFVGAMVPRKNLPLLLEAFEAFAPRHPDVRLLIAGHKTKRWASDWPKVETWLRDNAALAERVRILNYVKDADLRGLYRAAAALVLPSLTEGFGLTVLEGFASGVPVVASRAGAIPEVGGDAAYYCDPRSAESLVVALDEALAADAARVQRGLAIAREHTWQRTATLTRASYAAAAAGAPVAS